MEIGKAHHRHAGLFQENLYWEPHVHGYIPKVPDGNVRVTDRWDCRPAIPLRLERWDGMALGTGVLQ